MKRKTELPADREAVLKKIRDYEKLGGDYFFCDVEQDPPARTLMPSDVDYLHSTAKFKLNGFSVEALNGSAKMSARANSI